MILHSTVKHKPLVMDLILWKFDLLSAACSKDIFNTNIKLNTRTCYKKISSLQNVLWPLFKTFTQEILITIELTLMLIFIIKFVFNFLSLAK